MIVERYENRKRFPQKEFHSMNGCIDRGFDSGIHYSLIYQRIFSMNLKIAPSAIN